MVDGVVPMVTKVVSVMVVVVLPMAESMVAWAYVTTASVMFEEMLVVVTKESVVVGMSLSLVVKTCSVGTPTGTNEVFPVTKEAESLVAIHSTDVLIMGGGRGMSSKEYSVLRCAEPVEELPGAASSSMAPI